MRNKSDLLNALIKEISLRKFYLQNEPVETMYFGGGTPSLLDASEINRLTDALQNNFQVSPTAEVTLEANPDDLSAAYLSSLKNTRINRLSIGLQSFFEEDLWWMNRAHTSIEAESCVVMAQDAGIHNISVDLIYGYDLLTQKKWRHNIQKAIRLRVNHISAYSMTIEPKTVLANRIDKGLEPQPDDEKSANQFIELTNQLKLNGYEHYEISNFALPGQYSKHNTNYWRSVPYLGLGPSAHSFDGLTRQWNVSNNHKYISSINEGTVPYTTERLSKKDRQNEYVMTGLRTMWGINLGKIALMSDELLLSVKKFIDKKWLIKENDRLKLTEQGKLYADYIAAALFV